jgi:hypothetical protein
MFQSSWVVRSGVDGPVPVVLAYEGSGRTVAPPGSLHLKSISSTQDVTLFLPRDKTCGTEIHMIKVARQR